jgi:hypothetical protein
LNYVSTVADKATFQIVDALGKTLLSSVQNVNIGSNDLVLCSDRLKAGVHFLVVSVGDKIIQRQTLVVE